MSACVRCRLPAAVHPIWTGDVFCLHHVPPAPLWRRALTRILGRRG